MCLAIYMSYFVTNTLCCRQIYLNKKTFMNKYTSKKYR